MSAATSRSLPLPLRLERAAIRGLVRLPRPLIERLGAGAPVNSDGERLAPEIALALAAMNRMPGNDFSERTVEKARHQIDEEALTFAATYPPFAVEEDLVIPGPAGPIPATRYRARAGESRGLLVFFHGGGWVVGSRVSHDSPVRFLAQHAEVDVLSVDYRLAPEHPFPAAIEDARAAWDYAVAQAPAWGLDPAHIAIGGDSAGGNMTASLALLLRGEPVQPTLQLLLFPATDLSEARLTRASLHEFADGFFLTRRQMDWYLERYLADPADALDPRASPLLADDLAGAAPAYLAVAGFDPLRDDGLAYAQRLEECGVPVEVAREGDLIHAFINVTGLSPSAYDATLRAAHAVRAAVTAG
ncbi:alpha/beta hydrolase [Nocardioides mangrovi]|uniref:Alpha/beta hydrolase n=1 Tax=Nocardioides mangrovi TaxID=2874580 RepID=A0ABS7U6R3_9ACTN|nr:alpha/beta hydrolase [Nocardioides mangrovi]MBZ5736674.1 alpha/beta hydrolase [Nocardioides mangrovi]